MSEYEYVRRKSDGLYVSVDGGFTNRRQQQAFVFYEGAALGIGGYLDNDEYEIISLPDKEAVAFEKAEAQKGQAA